ncbi:MAG: response regulator transcription factor [Myxococcales bacterium]|nr:response regulator transcription factor [Myxococcales bacterium]
MDVLIAEDHPEMLEFYARVVKADGHHVATCPDGRAALETLAQRRFDLVVLDLRMPHVDGFAVCRKMRESGDRTPVLALTGLTSEAAQLEAFEAGADDFVTKPCSYDVLRARVRAILRRSTYSMSVRLGHWQLDRDALAAYAPSSPNKPVRRFSPAEMRVLSALHERLGVVVAREELRSSCWDEPVNDDALSAVVFRLRQKVEGSGLVVRAVRGKGIVLEVEDAQP